LIVQGPSGGRNGRYDQGYPGWDTREKLDTRHKGDCGWQPVVVAMVGRTSLLVWDVPPDQEEPWRRFLQELSGSRHEEHAESRRRLGVSTESVWLAPKPSGGGVAIVYLEAEDPEWALRELAASDTPFDSWYGTEMRRLFGFDLARLPRVAGGELLFAWGEASSEGEQEPAKSSRPNTPLRTSETAATKVGDVHGYHHVRTEEA
jgi:hypothetical protein